MIGCILQARMSSSRLPGKIMKSIKNKPIIDYVITQLQFSKKIEQIVIATTNTKIDDTIIEYAEKKSIAFFRGSDKDVLDRYYKCAKKFNFSTIVRITSDNPLVDPEIIDKTITKFELGNFDYISTEHPPTLPQGYAVEVFSLETLENSWQNAKKNSEREHVSPYMYNNPQLFKLHNIDFETDLNHIRCTLDRKNDFLFLEKVISAQKKQPILLKDVLDFLNENPKLIEINNYYTNNEGYLNSIRNDKNIE